VKQLYCIVGWTEWMARCKFWEGWFFPSLKFIAFKLGLDHKTHWRAQAFALTSNRFFVTLIFSPTGLPRRSTG
jgi:hypothetical protein